MSAFEKITTDRNLQDHWLRRLVAGIIDGVIMAIIASIISVLAALPAFVFGVFMMGTFPFLIGILFFLYASFMESSRGTTFGKQIMNLKVTTTQGALPTLDKALIRNISKIYWILLLIDILIGMAIVGDPHQKYSDRWVGTTVVSTIDRGFLLPTPPSSSEPTPPSPPS
jgi:uncharacterized RDD family membrane protein YckC